MKFSIDWPPGFVSTIVIDPKTKKFETDFARAMKFRKSGGFDRHPSVNPGSVPYIASGPVEMMERAK